MTDRRNSMARVRNVAKGYRRRSDAYQRTPRLLFDTLNAEFGFTLDAAASKENALAQRFFTASDDSFRQTWVNEIVWLNPPYGKGVIEKWMRKAAREAALGALVICLVPASTEQPWWQDIVMREAREVRFVRGRLFFESESPSKPGRGAFGPHAVIVFGPQFAIENGPRFLTMDYRERSARVG